MILSYKGIFVEYWLRFTVTHGAIKIYTSAHNHNTAVAEIANSHCVACTEMYSFSVMNNPMQLNNGSNKRGAIIVRDQNDTEVMKLRAVASHADVPTPFDTKTEFIIREFLITVIS